MADITQTAANVALSSGSAKYGQAGGTITAGMPVYKDSADGDDLKACQADDVVAQAACVGIALNSASDKQPLVYAPTGSVVNLGATLTVGKVYCVSANAGAIAPVDDLTTGDYVTVLGVATTAALITLGIIVSGVEVPA